jgi:tRNA threonylcarbamoyladenosine biosynthesis protein TsaB
MPRLAIETSTENCSVALQSGQSVLNRDSVEPRAHARLILPWARELLTEAGIGFGGLDSLVVGRGPGGFTSLRIGLGIVQGLALAHDLPVYPVSSLDALALDIARDHPDRNILAVLDARMGEVYAAWYQPSSSGPQRIGEERLLAPNALAAVDGSDWLAAGPGARAHAGILTAAGFELPGSDQTWPDARAVLELSRYAEPVAAHGIEPVYLRDQVTG